MLQIQMFCLSLCAYTFPCPSSQTHYQLRVPPCGSGKGCVVRSLEFCSGRAACRALGLQTLALSDAVEPFQTSNIRNSSGSTELQKKYLLGLGKWLKHLTQVRILLNLGKFYVNMEAACSSNLGRRRQRSPEQAAY